MNDHPQTAVYVYDQVNGRDRVFHCDVELAPILAKLNEIGATTIFSCQNLNHDDIVQIGFSHDVPRAILSHAVTIISAAYPDRYILLNCNDCFDTVVEAIKTIKDYKRPLFLNKFDRKVGTYRTVDCVELSVPEPKTPSRKKSK